MGGRGLEAGLKVGDEHQVVQILIFNPFDKGLSTNDYYVDYDAYNVLKNSRDAKEAKIQPTYVMKVQALETNPNFGCMA